MNHVQQIGDAIALRRCESHRDEFDPLIYPTVVDLTGTPDETNSTTSTTASTDSMQLFVIGMGSLGIVAVAIVIYIKKKKTRI